MPKNQVRPSLRKVFGIPHKKNKHIPKESNYSNSTKKYMNVIRETPKNQGLFCLPHHIKNPVIGNVAIKRLKIAIISLPHHPQIPPV